MSDPIRARDAMDCTQVALLLDEYAAGELAGTERAAANGHLGRCPHCRRALQHLSTLDARIRALPAPTAPDGFLAAIHAKLPGERFGFDQRATAPSAWFDDEAPRADMHVQFLRFGRIAA